MADAKNRDEKADDTLNKLAGETEEDRGARPASASSTYAGTAGEGGATASAARRTSLGDAGSSAMQSVGDIGGSAVGAGRNVLRGAIGATEDVGTGVVGGVAHIATDLVHGVTDLGYEVRNGATGLIGAVGDIGGAAVHTVTNLLVDVVGGVRQVVAAAIGDHHEMTYRRKEGMTESERGETGMPPPRRTTGAAGSETGARQ